MKKDELKSVIRPAARAHLTASGAITSAKVSKVTGADGTDRFEVSTTTGTISPSPDAVESLTELLAEVLIKVIPELRVDVTITTSSGETGKGTGTVR